MNLLSLGCVYVISLIFFFKQKTAYEMRISDWSSDVCSSDLILAGIADQVSLAKRLILDHQLSKYNHAPPLYEGTLRTGDRRRILVLDQTSGDVRVSLGGEGADSFANMMRGRSYCRERVCWYLTLCGVAVSIHNNIA